MAGEIDINTVGKAYARWAPVYDLVFGAVFDAGRKASIAAAERIGGRILDVGIGTGISLTDYSPANRIVGVDYSEPMLRKAHERVAEHKLAHVEALAVMDAQHLGFPDASFDAVVAQYVITTVPDPGGDARRVRARHAAGRRDHPGQPSRRRGRAAPRLRAGLRAGGAPARLAAGIPLGAAGAMGRAATAACACVERRPMPPLGHFSLIRFERMAAGTDGQGRSTADALPYAPGGAG